MTSCNKVTQEERNNASRLIEANRISDLLEIYYSHNSNPPASFDKLKEFITKNSLADAVKDKDWNDLMNKWEIGYNEEISSGEEVVVAIEKPNDSKRKYSISYSHTEKKFKLSYQ